MCEPPPKSTFQQLCLPPWFCPAEAFVWGPVWVRPGCGEGRRGGLFQRPMRPFRVVVLRSIVCFTSSTLLNQCWSRYSD